MENQNAMLSVHVQMHYGCLPTCPTGVVTVVQSAEEDERCQVERAKNRQVGTRRRGTKSMALHQSHILVCRSGRLS